MKIYITNDNQWFVKQNRISTFINLLWSCGHGTGWLAKISNWIVVCLCNWSFYLHSKALGDYVHTASKYANGVSGPMRDGLRSLGFSRREMFRIWFPECSEDSVICLYRQVLLLSSVVWLTEIIISTMGSPILPEFHFHLHKLSRGVKQIIWISSERLFQSWRIVTFAECLSHFRLAAEIKKSQYRFSHHIHLLSLMYNLINNISLYLIQFTVHVKDVHHSRKMKENTYSAV